MNGSIMTSKHSSTSADYRQQSAHLLGGRFDSHIGEFQLLLDKIDEIRHLTQGEKDIKIPSVVVIGDQSHGKSSLLEQISGIDLPRGSGTKTRVPLELQLRHAKTEQEEKIKISTRASIDNINIDDDDSKWNNEQEIPVDKISDKIEEFTNILAGKDKNIVDKPIRLSVYRQDLVDLTLIDLPGIVRNVTNEKLPKVCHL